MYIQIDKKRLTLEKADSLVKRMLGLMFRKIKGDGMLFTFSFQKPVCLHMFFVFYSIDIVCLDKDKKIVEIHRDVKPFTPFIYCPPCKYILELRPGLDISINSKVSFIK